MPTDPLFYVVGLSAVFLISFGKGAFGGGLALLGVPMLALVEDPITASIMMAPIVAAGDPFGIWAYPPRTWSWKDLAWLVPGMLVGLGLGAFFFVHFDPRLVALAIAVLSLWFAARWFILDRKLKVTAVPPSPPKALACGTLSGFTTFISHAGNPPIAYYLLPRGLDKTTYAGTLTAFFTVGNLIKLLLYFWLSAHNPQAWLKAAILLPVIPLGVWVGKRFHDWIDEYRLYFTCYSLIALTGAKLLYDSVRALLV
jgi:uncharacterized membrane protein YfcA